MLPVRGNDDDRLVHVRADELFPSSHLRAILLRCPANEIRRVNMGRDTLRSLVATQRLGKLIVKGDATRDEVQAELDRDCVDLPLFRNDAACDALLHVLCVQLTHALVEWPLFKLSTLNGLRSTCEWSASPSHCVVGFVAKPRLDSPFVWEHPFVPDLLRIWCRHLRIGATTIADLMRELPADRLHTTIEDDELFGPFWCLVYDEGQSAPFEPLFVDFARHFQHEPDDESVASYVRAVLATLRRYLLLLVDLSVIFTITPRQVRACQHFEHAIAVHGWRVTEWTTRSRVKPLIAPSFWSHEPTRGVYLMLEASPK